MHKDSAQAKISLKVVGEGLLFTHPVCIRWIIMIQYVCCSVWPWNATSQRRHTESQLSGLVFQFG